MLRAWQCANLNGLGAEGLDLPELQLPETKLDLPELDKSKMGDIKGLENVGALQDKPAQLGELNGQVGSYTEKIKSQDQLASEAENYAKGMDELSGFEDATEQFKEMEK